MALALGDSSTNVNVAWENEIKNAINANTVITALALKSDGSVALTANWDVGAYTIRVTQLISDIAIGTPPLVITSTTVVPNLNVDQVDGFDLDQALLIASSPTFAGVTLGNSGLHILDTNASHDLIITPGSNLTADRILTLTTGDAARTLTMSGDATISDWFDQAVKAASSPTFAGVTLGNSGLHVLDTNASHDLVITPGSDLSADRILTLTTGDAARTITLSGNPTLADWFDQAVKAASSPAFAGIIVGNTGLHILDTNASHDLILKPESDLTADRTLSITTGDQNRAVVLSNYAGIYFDDNGGATTILLVDAFEPIDVFDTDMPETISNGAHGTDNITIGETAVYEVHMNFYAISGGVNKVYEFYAFEIAASGDAITGATEATPCVITAVGHSFNDNDKVKISGVSGMTELNGQIYTVTNKGTDTFELEDDNGADINSGGYTSYTSGGTAYLATELTQVHVERKFATSTDVGSFSGSGLVSLTSGNTIEAYVKGTTDNTDITIVGGQLWIKRV